MPAPKKLTHKDKVADSTTLNASASVDEGLHQALIDEETGFMRAGAMPSVTAASAAGCKQLLDAVAKATLAVDAKNSIDPTDLKVIVFPQIYKCEP